MRPLRPLSGVLSLLALVYAVVELPAAAERAIDPPTRTATRAVVHGRFAGATEAKATSFDVFSDGREPIVAADRPGSSPRAPGSTLGFDALADLDGFFPADPSGALGTASYVAATNVRVAVFDRSGLPLLGPTRLMDLHPDGSGILNFDPKVVHDPFTDTHVLVWLGLEDAPPTSVIFVAAIPDSTAADLGTWCVTSFAGDQVASDPARWADYPSVGFDDDRVVVSTNQFTFPSSRGRFAYAQLLSIPKPALYDCTQPPPLPDVFAGTATRDRNGVQASTIQPAQTLGTSSAHQLLVSVQLAGKASYLTIWRLKDTATGLELKRGNVPIGRTKLPPAGTQGGGSLADPDTYWDAGDERLVNAFYDSDRRALYAAHAVGRNLRPDRATGGYREAVARWYEVRPAGRLRRSSLVRSGLVGEPEVDVGWPTVATDAAGNLFVTYGRASQPRGEFLSAWVAEILPGATTGTQLLLEPGLALYDAIGGIERWGDFTAINRDPAGGGAVATFNQYANALGTWQQVVHLVAHA
ncbi:MAG TPA: hypothetical protein VE669_05150 [Actinomycetota bacterium]|nr:hypothetical protein [Actinomycetota bacterium]